MEKSNGFVNMMKQLFRAKAAPESKYKKVMYKTKSGKRKFKKIYKAQQSGRIYIHPLQRRHFGTFSATRKYQY